VRVVRFHAPGDLRFEEAPEPVPAAGEVRIAVRACSACGTDVKIRRGGHPAMTAPQVMGHEIAGEVLELGPGVDGVAVGDRVQLIAAIPDGTCAECRAGHPSTCLNQVAMGYQLPGGYADQVVAPAAALAAGGLNRIPDHVSFAEASLAEPLACVVNGQELARVGESDTVVVIGAGPIGCLHVRLARARGAARILLLDRDAARLRTAAALVIPDLALATGDDDPVAAVLDATDGRGADVVIVAAASADAQRQGLGMLARRGRLSLFAGLRPGASEVVLDANLVHYRELAVVGANGSSPDQNRRALALIASGEVPVADLITHTLPLDRVQEALDLVERGEAIKVTVVP